MTEYIIKTDDEMEARRITKSLHMALFIFQLLRNTKLCDADGKKVSDLIDEYSIDIDDLIE